MDNFTYNYLNIGSNPSNRLGYVSDVVTASSYTDDIDAQNPAGNYSYDELGQLVYDQQEMIASIEWRSGDKKIKTLTRTANAGNKPDLEFVYNPMGQRVLKIEKPRTANVLDPQSSWKYTYYAYDANGQVMATYLVNFSNNGLGTNRATLTEQNIYGASRLGMRRKSTALYNIVPVPYIIPDVKQNTLGDVAYEITNYLGNVNVVISDRKIYVPVTAAFKACTLSRTDYYPFGMEISSRTTVGTYRFGYNGMEQDPEAKGEGNSYTTEFRQYDPRLGRWLSLDPLMAQYPMMSPYVAFNNNPIYFVDPLGLEGVNPRGDNDKEVDGIDGKDNITWNNGNNKEKNNDKFDNYKIDPRYNKECLMPGADVPDNVYVKIRKFGSSEYYSSNKDSYIEGNFLMIFATSLNDASVKRNSYYRDQKNTNTLINLHGKPEAYRDEFNQLIYTGKVYINEDEKLSLDNFHFYQYAKNKLEGDVKKEIDGLLNLINFTSDNFLLLSCTVASDNSLREQLIDFYMKFVTSGANFYINAESTAEHQTNSSGVDINSRPLTAVLKKGWFQINKQGGGYLMKNKTNTGNIIFNGFSNEPIQIQIK